MTDAQNSPAPSETERAVEVAAGLTPFEAQLVLAIQRLSDLGVLRCYRPATPRIGESVWLERNLL